MDTIERGFADAENKWTALLKADIGSALNEIRGETICDCSERSHGAGKDDHAIGGIAAAGDVGTDVVVGEVLQFQAGCAEEFFR